MLLLGMLFSLGTLIVFVAAVLGPPMAPFIAALTLSPLYLTGIRVGLQLLSNEVVGLRGVVRAFPRSWRAGVWIGFPPALVVSILVSTVEFRDGSDVTDVLILAAIVAEALVLILLAVLMTVIYPLAALSATVPPALWRGAGALVGRNLGASALLFALTGGLIASVIYLGPVLLLIAVGPLCVLNAAIVRGPMLGQPTPDRLL